MLIAISDIEARTGETYVDQADIARVNAFIEDVSALIESYCRRQFTAPVPTTVKALAAREVIAALNTDPGIASERIGDLSTTYTYSGSVTSLSSATRLALRPYRRKVVGAIQLVAPDYAPPSPVIVQVPEPTTTDPAPDDPGVAP